MTLPCGCTSYNLSDSLHVDTAESSTTTGYDTLTVQMLNSSGTVLTTLHTYSNLDHNERLRPAFVQLGPVRRSDRYSQVHR